MKPDFHYRCTRCGRSFDHNEVVYLCPNCSRNRMPGMPLEGVLEVMFDFDAAKSMLDPMSFDLDLIVPVEPKFSPPLQVGDTPLFESARLAESLELDIELWIKNDALNPSGSLKDRASFAVAAEARRKGIGLVVTASTGNAASSMSALSAASGLDSVIFAPASAPRAKLVQILVHGSKLVLVDGTYDQAFELSIEYSKMFGGLNRNTAYNPMTVEGKKTAALEIFTCLGRMPDMVVVPVGDGVILAAIHKGFKDIQRLGLAEHVPRLVAVQAETSDAIHNLFTTGCFRPAMPDTLADSISVSVPSNAWWAVAALKESQGLSVTVSDKEIIEAQRDLARLSGVFAEPAAASTLAGLLKLAKTASFPSDGLVVLLVTGHGLKDIEAPMKDLEMPRPIPPVLDFLEEMK